MTSLFGNSFQSGFLSILYSIGSKPLGIWDSKVGPPFSSCAPIAPAHVQHSLSPVLSRLLQVRNGHIKRITDTDIQSLVIEICGTNVR